MKRDGKVLSEAEFGQKRKDLLAEYAAGGADAGEAERTRSKARKARQSAIEAAISKSLDSVKLPVEVEAPLLPYIKQYISQQINIYFSAGVVARHSFNKTAFYWMQPYI